MLRTIRSHPRLRRAVAALGAVYVRLVCATTRWTVEGAETAAAVHAGRGRWVIGIWHGRLLAAPGEKYRRMNVRALISANNDGQIIADAMERFDIISFRGSSHDQRKPDKDKRGARAAAEAGDWLVEEENAILVLTPDGPRGPRMRCQPGVAMFSMVSGAPVVPLAFATRRAFTLGSWDRFLLHLPFTRGGKVWGEPLHPPADRSAESAEAFRLQIEAAMNAAAERADILAGRPPVPPADPRRSRR